MKANEIKQALKLAYAMRKPLFISGPPGVGKSQIVSQFCQEAELSLIDCRLVYWDPVDLRGIPHVADGKTTWLTPSTFPTEGNGILFLDELPQAAPAVQAACFQLTLDRKLADYTLPDGWSVVCAGNAQSDRAGANRLLSPLVSRLMFCNLDVDLQAWSEWAIARGLNPLVLAFLRFRIPLLHEFDPSKWDGKSYACPRSWETLADALDHQPKLGVEMLGGIVGQGAAAEFSSYRDLVNSLPSLDSLIMSPDTAPIPEQLATLYAVSCGLARKATPGNFGKVMVYVNRLPREFEALTVKDAISGNRALEQTPEWVQWCVHNNDLLT